MKKFKLTNQHKAVIGVVVVIGIVIFYLQAIKPINIQIGSKKEELRGLQEKLEQAKAIAARRAQLEAEIADIQLAIKQTEKKLPTTKEIPQFLRDITAAADRLGIVIATFSPQQTKEQQYYLEIPISLNISTSFHRLAEFLADIGQYERIIKAENIQFTPKISAENPYTTVNINFRLITYAYGG